MTSAKRAALALIVSSIAMAAPLEVLAQECDGLTLTQSTVDPLMALPLVGPIPQGFESVVFQFEDDLIVDQPLEEGQPPRAPVNPLTSMEGGAAHVWLRGNGKVCDLGEIALGPLTPAPGALSAMLAQSRAQASAFETAFGLTRSPSGRIEGWSSTLPSGIQTIIALQQTAEELVAMLGDDPVANAIAAQTVRAVGLSGPPPVLRMAQATPAQSVRVAQAVFGSDFLSGSASMQCPTTADQLATEVDNAFQAWAYSEANQNGMTAAGFIISTPGLVVAIAGEAAATAGLTAVAGTTVSAFVATNATLIAGSMTAGAAIPMLNLVRNDVLSKHLMRDIDLIHPDLTATQFLEDAPTTAELTGAMTNAEITATSRGGDLRGAVVSILTGFGQLGAFESVYGALLGLAVSADEAAHGPDPTISLAPRKCVLDAFGHQYFETRIVPPGWDNGGGWTSAPPVQLITHAIYRAVDVGEAYLYVGLRPGVFGDSTTHALVRLEVLEVYLTVNPADQYVAPGDAVGIEVSVHNSAHPDQSVNFSVRSGVIESVGVHGGRNHVIYTLPEPGFLPAIIAFEPTRMTGLMTRPTARDRTVLATIRPERLSLSRPPFCLEAGEDHQFGSFVSTGDDDAWPAWITDFGGIDQIGLYTAPTNARGETATVTATLGDLEASVSFRVGACTCFWDVSVGGQEYSGYYAYFPVLLDQSMDRDGDGVLELYPLVDGRPGEDDEPTVREVALQALMINYPRDTGGPAISITFAPPWTPGAGYVSSARGSMSAETTAGIRTDLTRSLSARGIVGSYQYGRDFVDVDLAGQFQSFSNGNLVDSQFVTIKARARAGFASYSACEGPHAPLPGGWFVDALPQGLPQLPQINR